MVYNDVRKGVTNASFNESNSTFLFLQIFLLSIALGVSQDSWWIFGFSLIAMIFALQVNFLALMLIITFSLGWGAFGYYIGEAIGASGASFVLSILAFLAALGGNLSGLQWAKDLGE